MVLDDVERKQFAEDNINLVYHVIHKHFKSRIGRKFEFDDFVSVGMIGLLKAIDNFKPEYGNKFSTYAIPMVWGEISRELRDKELMLKIPRPIKNLQYQAFKNNLLDSTAGEVAEKLGVSEYEAVTVLQSMQVIYVDSLDREIGEDGNLRVYEKVGGYQEDYDTGLMIEDINAGLDSRQKEILRLTMSGKTQDETASSMGISQAQISRILSGIKLKIKKYTENDIAMIY
jgi:RNA polymerase sporulation-specific sigma factor